MDKKAGDAPRGWTGADEADVVNAAADADVPDHPADSPADEPEHEVRHLHVRTPLTLCLDLLASALFGLVIARMLLVWFWRTESSGAFKLAVASVIAAGFLAAAQRAYAFLRDFVHGQSRSVAYAITALGFFGAFVQPMTLSRTDYTAAEATLAKSKAEIADLHSTLRAKWRADVSRAGAHAPNGTAPPMFSVEDNGNVVRLAHVTRDKAACVVVRRVNPHGDEFCEFATAQTVVQGCAFMNYDERATFTLVESPHDCAQWPLEFRVGDYLQPDHSWWSDGALREFDAGKPAASVHRVQ